MRGPACAITMCLALWSVACGKDSAPQSSAAPPPAQAATAPDQAASSTPAPAETTPDAPAQAATGPAGTWSGTWQRTKPAPGGGELELTIEAGGAGSIRAAASACYPAGKSTPATVEIAGTDVKIAVDGNGVKAQYAGKLSGDEMSGTMTVSCAAGTGVGNWKLKRR